MHLSLSESASFCKIQQTFWCAFAVHSSNCHSLAKCECCVSQGNVEILFRWGGKRLHFCTTNLLRTICTKFYQSWSGFVEDMTKTFWCFFPVHTVVDSAGWAIRISWSKCSLSVCLCVCVCVCVSVCLDVNQGGTNCNCCTQRLAILKGQTYKLMWSQTEYQVGQQAEETQS